MKKIITKILFYLFFVFFLIDSVAEVGFSEYKIKKLSDTHPEEKVIFDFDNSISDWKIPDWAQQKEEYVGRQVILSEKKDSLEVKADFPGGKWTAAYIEHEQYFDWSAYSEIAVDIYVPKDTPSGLIGKIILTVGEDWKWTEMIQSVYLLPGKWTTISASLMPGSIDWRDTKLDEGFRAGIRKFGVRVESDRKPTYKGSLYIDKVRLSVLSADKMKEVVRKEPLEEEIIFEFNNDTEAWKIPGWALEKKDYVGKQVILSEKKDSLEVKADFPGGNWTAAYIEHEKYFDWSDYSDIAVDIFIPENTPAGL
ncbi:MAG: hypothetical protein ABH868_07170, partial [bacterium]